MSQHIEITASIDLKRCLDDLFTIQQREINRFYDVFDTRCCMPLISRLLDTQGTFFWSGIGKSGFIAGKIAGTLMSLGERSAFLSVVDALHGDLGVLRSGDSICFLSKSGDSCEILNLIPHLKAKGVTVCSITSSAFSRLAVASDIFIEMPCPNELCPFNLIPTISSEIQLMIGDLITAVIRELKQVTLSDYGCNHPQGKIGLRANTKVVEIMLPLSRVPVCSPEATLRSVMDVFSSSGCGCLILLNQKRQLVGIFTDGDLRRSLQKFGSKLLDSCMKDLATPSPQYAIRLSTANEALMKMEYGVSPISMLPVVKDDQDKTLLGLLRMHDLIRCGIV